jgi:demethylmenaquinone methyltransferase / 2-methoxy-6-polyprenyl-1,4-benzoquinol methylase
MQNHTSKSAHVHDVFSNIAHRYDLMNTVLSFWQHKLWRRFAMKKTHLSRSGQVLDVACGTGDWTIALAKVVGHEGSVTGLDFVQQMLDVARVKVEKKNLPQIQFVSGNAMDLPFADDSFDVVTIGFALRNVPDVLTVLKEMTRVTKPGGQVISLELSKPQWRPFRALYYFYFYKVLPVIGSLAVGKKEPYAWLPESLTDFPDRLALEEIFQAAGLTQVKSYPLTGGVAALHIGIKVED